LTWPGDAHPLNDAMWLVDTELTRSKLYHHVKWQLPHGSALMVAPLEDRPACWPKFKGMEMGVATWLRERPSKPANAVYER